MKTIDDILQHLALKYPEWGKRDGLTLIKIPKGDHATFISGKAAPQFSEKTGKAFKGGGYQVRFRDFDENWIVKTVRLDNKK